MYSRSLSKILSSSHSRGFGSLGLPLFILQRNYTNISSKSKDIKRLRRVLFNVPGNDERKIQKATQLKPDCVVLDLEDGVAINQKEEARKKVVQSFCEMDFGNSERLVRINSIGSGLEREDLESVAKIVNEGKLDSLVIPKVENAQQLLFIDQFLKQNCSSLHSHNIKFLAAIESAYSLINLKEICMAVPERIESLIFASEDFCADMGMTRTPQATELLYARSSIVTHAVAFGLQAIDMVCLDYKNESVLAQETLIGRQMGYTGKQAIHPAQIEPIIKAFRPSDQEISLAKRIVEENEKNQAEGKGAWSIDGKMIDMPMVKWARVILQRASH